MNKKIRELSKFSNTLIEKISTTFLTNAFCTWNNSTSGHGGYASVGHNQLYSRYHYVGNGGWAGGQAHSNTTIQKLKNAEEISFTYSWSRWGSNVWAWNSYTGYFRLLNQFVTLDTSSLRINDVVLTQLSEDKTYNVVLKQRYAVVNGTKFDYPQNVQLKNAAGDYCDAYCSVGQVTAGGHACVGDLYINVGDMTVKR